MNIGYAFGDSHEQMFHFCIGQDMLEVPEHPDDAILLLKQNVCSDRLSQPPQLLFPHAYLSKLDPAGPCSSMPRNKLSTRALKEFRKTAGVVSEHPWNLFSAANYLREITKIKEIK